MEFLKCLGLVGGSLMVFMIAGGSAELQHHRAMETRVDQKVERSELKQTGKVLVEMYTVIDDGITKRTLKSQIVVDSIYDRDVENLNSALKEMTYNTVMQRQKEIDDTKFISINQAAEETLNDVHKIVWGKQMSDLTDADWKRMDEHFEELGKEWKAEAERLQPYTDILKKHLKKEFPENVTDDNFSNAVNLDFKHGYIITVYVDEKHPLEYSWTINEQDLMSDGSICSPGKKYYTINELIKFLNSIKEWL